MTYIVLGFVAFVAIIFVGVVVGKSLDNEEGK
nr:MAG TPA: membrane protein [Caudoviricetes sp.]